MSYAISCGLLAQLVLKAIIISVIYAVLVECLIRECLLSSPNKDKQVLVNFSSALLCELNISILVNVMLYTFKLYYLSTITINSKSMFCPPCYELASCSIFSLIKIHYSICSDAYHNSSGYLAMGCKCYKNEHFKTPSCSCEIEW